MEKRGEMEGGVGKEDCKIEDKCNRKGKKLTGIRESETGKRKEAKLNMHIQ